MKFVAKLALFGAAAYGGYRLVKKYNLVEKAVELVDELKERGTDALGQLFSLAPTKPEEPVASPRFPSPPPEPADPYVREAI